MGSKELQSGQSRNINLAATPETRRGPLMRVVSSCVGSIAAATETMMNALGGSRPSEPAPALEPLRMHYYYPENFVPRPGELPEQYS